MPSGYESLRVPLLREVFSATPPLIEQASARSRSARYGSLRCRHAVARRGSN